MTVISTIITRHYTAHASDSLVTTTGPDGARSVVEEQQSKLVRVPGMRGVMGYWGLARHGSDWNTLEWLRGQATRAQESSSASEFADALNCVLSNRRFAKPADAGLGIHFTAYERVDDRWVPELFLVSNWTDTSYMAVQPQGFRATREGTVKLSG